MSEINSVKNIGLNPGQVKKDTASEIKKASAEFEALFINQMLKVMRETVVKGGVFHGGNGEDIYNSLFDSELSNLMAKGGGIGLQKIFTGQLSGNYESDGGIKKVEKEFQLQKNETKQVDTLNTSGKSPYFGTPAQVSGSTGAGFLKKGD